LAATDPTRELNSFQTDCGLPFIRSSNARDVVETHKVSARLEVTTSTGILH